MNSQLKILISGANGQLGQEFQRKLSGSSHEYLALDTASLDITDSQDLERHISNFKPNIFINCAAYTAVDLAEDEIERCNAVNTNALHLIGKICKEHHCRVLHFSTDYVFNGESSSAYTEHDATAPLNIYGLSKRNGELALQSSECRSTTLRLSWLYSEFGTNFPKKMLELFASKEEVRIIDDQVSSPTWTKPLVEMVVDHLLLRDELFDGSIYHYSEHNEGSWFDVASLINSDKQTNLAPISSFQFSAKADRPSYSKLDGSLLEKTVGFTSKTWQENLEDFLRIMTQ